MPQASGSRQPGIGTAGRPAVPRAWRAACGYPARHALALSLTEC